jgi:HK97 family phage portal protein
MKFNLRNLIQRSKGSTQGRAKNFEVSNDTSGVGYENIFDAHNLNTYKTSLYLYIGVNMIAKRVAGIPFSLFKITNSKGEFEEVFSNDLIDSMNKPNPRQTRKEFWELTVMFYLLSGDAFWYLEKTGKKVIAMHALRPDYVEVVTSKHTNEIVAYEYRSGNGTTMQIPAENILHFKNIDPTNQLRGVGVVRPASSRIITERDASAYQSKFFKNQGRPDVAVFVDTEITTEDAEEARERWRKIYGNGNGGQAGFFGSDIKDMKELNVTPKEMDFINSQKFLRDDILAVLHIPKAMITSDDVNLANAKVARLVYLEEAVVPMLDTMKDVLNNMFLDKIDKRLFFDYENPVPADREMIVKELTAYTGKVITQNEARERLGYKPMDGADDLAPVTFESQMQLAQTSSEAKQVMKTRPMLYKELLAIDKLAEVLVLSEQTSPKRKMNPIFTTKKQKDAFAKEVNVNVERRSNVIKGTIDEFHNGMFHRIKEINKDGYTVESFMAKNEEKIIAKNLLGGVLKKEYEKNGQHVLDSLFDTKKAIGDAEAFVFTVEQERDYDARVEFFTHQIVETTFDQLKSVVIEGMSNGDGVDKIGRTIRSKFDDISVGRANTIARTETNYALSRSTVDAYGQSTVVTGVEWITAGDGSVRDEHVANASVGVLPKGSTFPSGEQHCGELSINCRCVLAPAV